MRILGCGLKPWVRKIGKSALLVARSNNLIKSRWEMKRISFVFVNFNSILYAIISGQKHEF